MGHEGGALPCNVRGRPGVKSPSIEPTICAAVISAADTVFPMLSELASQLFNKKEDSAIITHIITSNL